MHLHQCSSLPKVSAKTPLNSNHKQQFQCLYSASKTNLNPLPSMHQPKPHYFNPSKHHSSRHNSLPSPSSKFNNNTNTTRQVFQNHPFLPFQSTNGSKLIFWFLSLLNTITKLRIPNLKCWKIKSCRCHTLTTSAPSTPTLNKSW